MSDAGIEGYITAIVRREVAAALAAERAKSKPPDDYLSVTEVAELAHVDPGTARRWCREGRLGEQCRAGRHRRVRRADLERLLHGVGSGELTDREIDAMAARMG